MGVAGKLLTQTLQEIGLRREEVWISNMLKCRPPNNRDPLPEELAAYSAYLDREVDIIEPKVIVTLGRFSMGKFLPGVKISQVHGQARWMDWQGRKILVVPMYHPAAALRAGEVMRQFKADFGKLRDMINKIDNISAEEAPAAVEEKPAQLSLI